MDRTVDQAKTRVTLALLSGAARNGASDEGLAAMLARISGEQLIVVTDYRHGDEVQVKVDRVHSVGPGFPDGTILAFTELETWHPKYTLHVADDTHKVIRRLRENGWKY